MTFLTFIATWNITINATIAALGTAFITRKMKENKQRRGQ